MTIDFSPVPWQRSLGKVNSTDPRIRLASVGWMGRKRQPQWRGRVDFSLPLRNLSRSGERWSRRPTRGACYPSQGRNALNGDHDHDLPRSDTRARSWDWEIGIRKRKLSALWVHRRVLFVWRLSRSLPTFQSTLIECMIGWKCRTA